MSSETFPSLSLPLNNGLYFFSGNRFLADAEAFRIVPLGLPMLFGSDWVPYTEIRKLRRTSVGSVEIIHTVGPEFRSEVRGEASAIDEVWKFLKSRRPDIVCDEADALKQIDEESTFHTRLMLTVILAIVGVAVAASAAKHLLDNALK